MSYTNNQDSYDTTGNTANQSGNPKSAIGGAHFGDTGNPNAFSNTGAGTGTGNSYGSGQGQNQNQSSATGGGHFGESGDPNTYSNVGNTYGSGNQPSGNYGTDTQNQNQNQSTGRGGGSGAYGAGNNSSTDPNAMGNSGNTMAGAGEGFAAGTGTGFANDRRGATEGEQSAYGNYSGGDANAPPPGFRGGANDPAYQPGQHYDYKRGGIVPEEEGEHRHRRRENENNNNNTSNDRNLQGSNTGSAGGEDWQSGATGLSRGEQAAVAGGVGGGALYGAEERKHRGAEYGENTGYGPVAGTGTDPSMANTGAPQQGGGNTNSNAYTASAIPNTDTTDRVTGTHRTDDDLGNTSSMGNTGTNTSSMGNVGNAGSGGGEGWKSGLTGLTEEEIRAVTQGQHARPAVEAHPNPSQMEPYDQTSTNANANTNY